MCIGNKSVKRCQKALIMNFIMNKKINHLDLTDKDNPTVLQTSAHLFSTTLEVVKNTPTVLR